MQNVLEIPLDLLDDFPSSPFRVRMVPEFLNLLSSISSHGVLQPIIVRSVGDRYQIISGHRRKHVCEMLRLGSIPGIVRECNDSEAILLMLDSNIHQRQGLLPSEKAFAYKMRSEVLSNARLGSRKNKAQAVYVDAFADKSVAAMETKEIDDKTFSDIIQEEINRINAKNQTSSSPESE